MIKNQPLSLALHVHLTPLRDDYFIMFKIGVLRCRCIYVLWTSCNIFSHSMCTNAHLFTILDFNFTKFTIHSRKFADLNKPKTKKIFLPLWLNHPVVQASMFHPAHAQMESNWNLTSHQVSTRHDHQRADPSARVVWWAISVNQATLPAQAVLTIAQNTNMIDELRETNCSWYCYFYTSAHISERELVVCNYPKARLLSLSSRFVICA
jgi:hypothetical protein